MTDSPIYPPFLTTLPDDVRDRTRARAIVREYRAGEVICAKGAPADALYFLLSGTLHSSTDPALPPTILEAGASFGESETLRGAAYSATVIANGDARIWVLSKRDLDALLSDSQNAALPLALTHYLAAKLARERAPVLRDVYLAHASGHGARSRARADLHPRGGFGRATPSRRLPLALVALLGLFAFSVTFAMGALLLAVVILSLSNSSSMTAPSSPITIPARKRISILSNKIARSAASRIQTTVPAASELPAATLSPQPTTLHKVVSGDTLSAIAQSHDMSVELLRRLNGLSSDLIRAGNELIVLAGGEPVHAVNKANGAPTPNAPLAQVPITVPATPQIIPAAAPTRVPLLWQMPPWTEVESAVAAPGQTYWQLVKAIYFDEAKAGGRVNIFVAALDERGKELDGVPVRLTWGVSAEDKITRKTESKRDPFVLPFALETLATHEMGGGSSFSPERGERGGYTVTLEGFPSEQVNGMGLPLRRHVAFLLVFQRAVK